MDTRLFAPSGPTVTPTERSDRRRAHLAAQGTMFETDTEPEGTCPACGGRHEACAATALELDGSATAAVTAAVSYDGDP